VAETTTAIANAEAFLEGNFPVLLDIKDSLQSASIGGEHPNIATE
jgi:hypothetical protein